MTSAGRHAVLLVTFFGLFALAVLYRWPDPDPPPNIECFFQPNRAGNAILRCSRNIIYRYDHRIGVYWKPTCRVVPRRPSYFNINFDQNLGGKHGLTQRK